MLFVCVLGVSGFFVLFFGSVCVCKIRLFLGGMGVWGVFYVCLVWLQFMNTHIIVHTYTRVRTGTVPKSYL